MFDSIYKAHNLVIDFETLGIESNACILSLGAVFGKPCAFNNRYADFSLDNGCVNSLERIGGEITDDPNEQTSYFYYRIGCYDKSQENREIDQATVDWWHDQLVKMNKEQSQYIQKELFTPEDFQSDLKSCITAFDQWTHACMRRAKIEKIEYVWGNGIDFDNAILKSAYNDCGIANPFDYRKAMDYRTAMRMLDATKSYRICPDIAHHALHDALAEYKTLQNVLRQYAAA